MATGFAYELAQEARDIIQPLRGSAGVISDDSSDLCAFTLFGTPVGEDQMNILSLYMRLLLAARNSSRGGSSVSVGRRYVIGSKDGEYILRSGAYIQGVCAKQDKDMFLRAVRTMPEPTSREPEQAARTAASTRKKASLADTVASLFIRFQVMRPLVKDGEYNDQTHSSTFYVFGAGPADRQYILDVYLRLLVATRTHTHPVICLREYVLRDKDGTPYLAHGYSVRGLCVTAQEMDIVVDALTLEPEHREGEEFVNIYVAKPDGTVGLSGPRNVPSSGWGNKGMRGVHSVGESLGYHGRGT